ncbi:hypothetical protein Tco_0764817 [Tanacetum coccineum]
MRKFIDGLGGVMPSNRRPIEMLCDNELSIAMANDLEILKGARHFQRKCHYIREVIQEREIVLKKVHTEDNIVDPFTKPMPFDKHYEHAMAIGIVPARSLIHIDDVPKCLLKALAITKKSYEPPYKHFTEMKIKEDVECILNVSASTKQVMWDLIPEHELDLDLEFADAYMEDLENSDDGVFWEVKELNENNVVMVGRARTRGGAL